MARKKFTKNLMPQVKKYLSCKGARCLFCHSKDIEVINDDILKAGQIIQTTMCYNCEGEWYDIYELTHVQVVSTPNFVLKEVEKSAKKDKQ